jgi:hypothetical protein
MVIALMANSPLMAFPFSSSGGYLISLIEVVWWIANAVDGVVYGKHDVTSSKEEK